MIKTYFTLLCCLLVSTSLLQPSLAENANSASPRNLPPSQPNFSTTRLLEPKNVPDFADDASATKSLRASGGTALKAGLESTTLPVDTRMRLILEYPVDAKVSLAGEIFEAHVRDDLFIGNSLLLPRGSLVRGRIVEVTKPRLISRAARIGLRLEQITTPTGEVIPLDAALEFQKGMTNQRGELDPGTSLGTRVESSVRKVTGLDATGSTRGALMAANIATLGAPVVATLIGSSAVALFRSGDNISLRPGQEIEVLLTNDLGLKLN